MLILNVVVLTLVSYFVGFYHGKGKIEIRKHTSKEEYEELSERLERERLEAQEQAKEIRQELEGILKGGDF